MWCYWGSHLDCHWGSIGVPIVVLLGSLLGCHWGTIGVILGFPLGLPLGFYWGTHCGAIGVPLGFYWCSLWDCHGVLLGFPWPCPPSLPPTPSPSAPTAPPSPPPVPSVPPIATHPHPVSILTLWGVGRRMGTCGAGRGRSDTSSRGGGGGHKWGRRHPIGRPEVIGSQHRGGTVPDARCPRERGTRTSCSRPTP